MALGVNRNTPGYIWRMEAETSSLEIETRKRAGNYILNILGMREGRWPKVCLREEIRGIINKNPTQWGRRLEKAFRETGDGEGIEGIYLNRERGKIKEKLEQGLRIKLEQEIQRDWSKIDSSKFCEGYKEWKLELGKEKYWENKGHSGSTKEQWARMRCGSVGRGENKGFKDTLCRVCRKEQETIEHIWNCEVARVEIKKEWVLAVEKWKLQGRETEVSRRLIQISRGGPIVGICNYCREFENSARSRTEIG